MAPSDHNHPAPNRLALLTCAALFVAVTAGAWAWFHVDSPLADTALEFEPKPSLPDAQFEPLPVSEQAMETLANTNLLNGRFTRKDRKRFTVFFSDWRAQTARQMNVVQHTPDICWVGGGWTAVNLGQPAKLELDFDGRKIPFECRAFRAPKSNHEELTLWCTLVSGQLFEEGERFAAEQDTQRDARARQASAGRRRGAEQFMRVVRDRIPGDGSKQFVRFSTGVSGDPARTLEELKAFGEQWLALKVTHPARNAVAGN